MLRVSWRCLGMLVALGALGTFARGGDAVVVYPAPAEEKLSEDFRVTVAGQNVPVYCCRVSAMPLNQVWPGYQRPQDQTELASFATWDMGGPVEVEVTSQRPVEAMVIRPSARGIRPTVSGKSIRFRLEKPEQLTVEVNGWHKALHLFANAPAAAAPDPKAPGVHYFAPGVHRLGNIEVKSGETVYLAGGAVVYGTIDVQGASNIRILGRGILDSSQLERENRRNWMSCIRLRNCQNVEVDGLILRDPPCWCLTTFGCSDVRIRDMKLIGLWRYNADGIDICDSHDVSVRDCFVRSFDDSLVIKGLNAADTTPIHDITFENCVVWNDWGRALEVGAETRSPEMRKLVFRNCDVIRTVDVALDVQHGDRAAVKDVLFEDIRVEVDDVNLQPRIQKSREEKYVESTKHCPRLLILQIIKGGWSQDAARGTMEGVTVRNCSVTGKPHPTSAIYGFDDAHGVENVLISNLRFNGQAAESLEAARIAVGKHARNVRLQGP